MPRRFPIVAAAQFLAMAAVASDPYPFEGYFALRSPGAAHAGCGFDVLHQSHSGEFSGYLLDRAYWNAHGTPRFVRYKHGSCTFDSDTAVDHCVTHVNHIKDVSNALPDRAKITVLDADSVAMLTLGEGDDPESLPEAPPFVFERCPFDAEQIEPLLTDNAADRTPRALQDMASARDSDVALQVIEAIKTR